MVTHWTRLVIISVKRIYVESIYIQKGLEFSHSI